MLKSYISHVAEGRGFQKVKDNQTKCSLSRLAQKHEKETMLLINVGKPAGGLSGQSDFCFNLKCSYCIWFGQKMHSIVRMS